MALVEWLIVMFLIIIIIVIAFIVIVIVIAGKSALDCFKSPFACIFGGKNRQAGTTCLTSTVCASGVCKVGRCMNKSGTLNAGDKCTAGTKFCPKGTCCGGIPVICRDNNPDGRQPGYLCTNCHQCASGNCIQFAINRCAQEDGKFPPGTWCGSVSQCAEFCSTGAGQKANFLAPRKCT